MAGFESLPSEEEFIEWLDELAFKGEEVTRVMVLAGFKALSIDAFKKRFLLLFETQNTSLLSSMLWKLMGPREQFGQGWSMRSE